MTITALVLDDDQARLDQFAERFAEAEWEHYMVKTAPEAIRALSERTFDVVFLDHDLGGLVMISSDREDTGAEVARWLAANPDNQNRNAIFIIHSFNPAGAKNIYEILGGGLFAPGVWLKKVFDKHLPSVPDPDPPGAK